MRILRNKNSPPTAGLVQSFIDSAYDNVKLVADNLTALLGLSTAITSGDLDNFMAPGDIDTLVKLNAILTDATLGSSEDFATAVQGAKADTAIQGPFASIGEAIGGTDNTKAMTALRVAQAIETFADTKVNNYEAAVDPTVTDDTSEGYSVGSVWINTTSTPPEAFRCADPILGAAIWLKTTLTSDEMAAVALSGNSDDLVEGASKLLMTVAERGSLATMEDNATADMTGAEIKVAYEGQADTNAFTDLKNTKLTNIEPFATADQTNAEIATGYNTVTPVVSQVDAEAGIATVAERWTPQRVGQAIAALGGAVGYLGQNLQTGTAYILVLDDAGKMISMNNASANTLTIPANASVAFPVDTRIDISQYGAGLTTVEIATDTLIGDAVSVGQYKALSLWKRTATEWVIFGGTTA